jgi:hypothetical protein
MSVVKFMMIMYICRYYCALLSAFAPYLILVEGKE